MEPGIKCTYHVVAENMIGDGDPSGSLTVYIPSKSGRVCCSPSSWSPYHHSIPSISSSALRKRNRSPCPSTRTPVRTRPPQGLQPQVHVVDIDNFQFVSPRRFDLLGELYCSIVVKVKSGGSEIGPRVLGLLFYGNHLRLTGPTGRARSIPKVQDRSQGRSQRFRYHPNFTDGTSKISLP